MTDWQRFLSQKRRCELAIQEKDYDEAVIALKKIEIILDWETMNFDEKLRCAYVYMMLCEKVEDLRCGKGE